MPHPPAPQEPPERAGPGTRDNASTASAPRASSASLRMAGPSLFTCRPGNAGRAAREQNVEWGFFRPTARPACGTGRPTGCFFRVSGGDNIREVFAWKDQNHKQGEMHKLQRKKHKLQSLARDLEAQDDPARGTDHE